MSGFLIAAPQSGSGKTTVSLAIMAALARRGVTVAPFKCGPDFIDPGYHRAVTGRPSINLDGWMCGEEFVRQTFLTRLAGQSIAVIEGAMGLFDGLGASGREGSSAQIAALTGAPVVLVVNARGMAASAAALVNGFAGFDSQIRVAGVIFNNVGSEQHSKLLREVLATHCPEVLCFGCIPRDESLEIPSRHLGLVTVEDNPLPVEFIARLADIAERCLDLDGLICLAIINKNEVNVPHPPPNLPFMPQRVLEGGGTKRSNSRIFTSELESTKTIPSPSRGGLGRGWGKSLYIAVARDAAFCFMYEDNLRLLREAGAELIFFSPLNDTELPTDIHGIYLPGGYPELYAEALHNNVSMKESIRTAIATNMPVYAECGGFVYLTEGIDLSANQLSGDFVGIFPVRCRMLSRRKALGYRQVKLTENVIIGGQSAVVRGHEFHYSEIGTMPEESERCYEVSRRGIVLGNEGFRIRNCLASYIHLHFGSNPDIAGTFVESCRTYSGKIAF
jgi:cobyrinic acid a,c-diamide synthase